MRRRTVAVVLTASFLAAGPVSADDKKPDAAQAGGRPGAPSDGRVKAAAEEFDAGVSAFKHKDYESAAAHFEAADAAVPSPKTLRQAIRARSEAGQGSRAATLAAMALDRYGGDATTAKLAHDTIEKYEALLYKVNVTCSTPCSLSIGTDAVPGEASGKRVIYFDPGTFTLNASFSGSSPGAPKEIEAKAGSSIDLGFEPKKKRAAPPPERPKPASPPAPSGATETPSKSELPPEDPKPERPPEEPERKGISPAFFAVGLVATVGVGAATIWSGVDTENNPGAAAVMAQCRGVGPSCPLYQEGLSKQTRTNALIGVTAGSAAITVVLAVFTKWSGNKKKPPVEPTASIIPGAPPAFGARGVF
jgi:hypothetical protein